VVDESFGFVEKQNMQSNWGIAIGVPSSSNSDIQTVRKKSRSHSQCGCALEAQGLMLPSFLLRAFV
jgi:hypothetical protein